VKESAREPICRRAERCRQAGRIMDRTTNLRIERLGPLNVAWVRAVSRSPEEDAWRTLSAWARPAGFLDDPEKHPVFGFNNPSPTPGVQEYGYEFWIVVERDEVPPDGIGLKEFEGGLYAVTSCALGPAMPQHWMALVRSVQSSRFRWRRSTHELERLRNPAAPPGEVVVDLYLPVEE
jgi:AraC family transcriptional regulator